MRYKFAVLVLLTLVFTACGPVATAAPTSAPVAATDLPPATDVLPVSTPSLPTDVPSTSVPILYTLNIFADSSLADLFTDLGGVFEASNPGVAVSFNFDSSQVLQKQIQEGASADLFASADALDMNALITSGLVDEAAAQIILSNDLVVILPLNNPAGIESLEDLAKPGVRLIVGSEESPIGRNSLLLLDRMDDAFGAGFKDQALKNVTANEDNVKLLVSQIELGEGDAGIVYSSDAFVSSQLSIIDVPLDLNVAVDYSLAPLTKSANADLALKFIELILSGQGQEIIQRWGFLPVQ